MKIYYLVDDRHSGRTTEVLHALLKDRREGKQSYYMPSSLEQSYYALQFLRELDDNYDPKSVLSVYNLDSWRGLRAHTIYIDNAERLRDRLYEEMMWLQPEQIVMVVQGEVYKRNRRISTFQ